MPVFGFCEGWLYLYSSKESAEIDIEPIDVENGEWQVFDANGNKLEVRVKTKRSIIPFFSKAWTEVVEPSSPNLRDKDEFWRLLIAGIQKLSSKDKSRFGIPNSDEVLKAMTVEQLVLLAQKAFRES